MSNLSNIPGKDLVTGTGRRAGKAAVGAGVAVIAIGGFLARHLVRRARGGQGAADDARSARDEAGGANADPIAEPPTPQAVADRIGDGFEAAPAAATEAADAPEAPEPIAEAPPAPEESPATERPPDADAAPAPEESPASEPPSTTGTDAPPKPDVEPGDRSKDREPHHALNNPVGDPDPTEWPDPFETRDDPRDPGDPDAHAPTNAESTSEPHPSEDPEAGDRAEPPKREKLDD
jgi:hypothetical protein